MITIMLLKITTTTTTTTSVFTTTTTTTTTTSKHNSSNSVYSRSTLQDKRACQMLGMLTHNIMNAADAYPITKTIVI